MVEQAQAHKGCRSQAKAWDGGALAVVGNVAPAGS